MSHQHNSGMDTFIDPYLGDYTGQQVNTLANAIYLRLMTPLGSYWADPKLGSRLHELRRNKDLSRIAVLARQYSQQALAPIVQDGRARRIDVNTQSQPGRLLLHIEVEDNTGRLSHFSYPVRIS